MLFINYCGVTENVGCLSLGRRRRLRRQTSKFAPDTLLNIHTSVGTQPTVYVKCKAPVHRHYDL